MSGDIMLCQESSVIAQRHSSLAVRRYVGRLRHACVRRNDIMCNLALTMMWMRSS